MKYFTGLNGTSRATLKPYFPVGNKYGCASSSQYWSENTETVFFPSPGAMLIHSLSSQSILDIKQVSFADVRNWSKGFSPHSSSLSQSSKIMGIWVSIESMLLSSSNSSSLSEPSANKLLEILPVFIMTSLYK